MYLIQGITKERSNGWPRSKEMELSWKSILRQKERLVRLWNCSSEIRLSHKL